jgi:hypothetical protein
VTDLQERMNDKPAADLWDARPDWIMVATGAALLVGWALWIGITAYRLLMT